jgi:uncharacterized SAM-binding protein YcdF (DUF218 family)
MSPAGHTSRRRWWFFLILASVVVISPVVALCWRIAEQASRQELHTASAIVVFGAAEYSGRPSPVFRARLDHAYDLFQQGLAPLVITTGGSGKDLSFSEGGVGRDYLMRRGISERHLIAETQGNDTAESSQRVARILRANGSGDCLAVSDPYHMYRIKQILGSQGITVYAAPRPESRPRTRRERTAAVLREAGSYLLWRLHLT